MLRNYQKKKRKTLYIGSDGQPRITSTTHLDKFFAGYRVPQITPAAIDRFILERQAVGEAPSTTNRALSALKRMFSLCPTGREDSDHSIYPDAGGKRPTERLPGCRRVPAPTSRTAGASPCYHHDCLFHRDALRRTEELAAVSLLEGTLTLHSDETKSGEARIVPLNHESR